MDDPADHLLGELDVAEESSFVVEEHFLKKIILGVIKQRAVVDALALTLTLSDAQLHQQSVLVVAEEECLDVDEPHAFVVHEEELLLKEKAVPDERKTPFPLFSDTLPRASGIGLSFHTALIP